MARIFNSIRKRLLTGGRFGDYLLYAIGEIALVVVGILIALQVNNWNEGRKQARQELAILREMRKNLDGDLRDSGYNIRANERLLASNRIVLRQLEERIPFSDSMRVHYGNIGGSTVQTANTSAYDNLKGIGFDLIRNDSLRQQITRLYSERHPYIRQTESNFDGKFQLEQFVPGMMTRVRVDTMWVSGRPMDAEALPDDAVFMNLLRMNIMFREFMLSRYTGLQREIEHLAVMIDEELERRR